jgi:hypothetical protein
VSPTENYSSGAFEKFFWLFGGNAGRGVDKSQAGAEDRRSTNMRHNSSTKEEKAANLQLQ